MIRRIAKAQSVTDYTWGSVYCDAYAKDGNTGNSDTDNPQYNTVSDDDGTVSYDREGLINGTKASSAGTGFCAASGGQTASQADHTIETDSDAGEHAYADTGISVLHDVKMNEDVTTPVMVYDVRLDDMGADGDGYLDFMVEGEGFIYEWDGSKWTKYGQSYNYVDDSATYDQTLVLSLTSGPWDDGDFVEVAIESWCGLWALNQAVDQSGRRVEAIIDLAKL